MEPEGLESNPLKVGRLAKRTGISVRTLHHYDQIGLLVPAMRTPSGHRLYGSEEIQRLQQIAALRQLGFSLEEIRDSLARPGFTLERTLELQIHRLGQQIEHAGRLLVRLERVHLRLQAAERVSVDELMHAIEETIMYDKYYTPEQLEKLEERRETVGDERIQEVQAEWARLFERFGAEMEKGTDPADESVLEIARQATSLIQEFTGGGRRHSAVAGPHGLGEPGEHVRTVGCGPEGGRVHGPGDGRPSHGRLRSARTDS